MTNLDEFKAAFEKKLDRQEQGHAAQLEAELQAIEAASRRIPSVAPDEAARRLSAVQPAAGRGETLADVRAQVSLTYDEPLRALDWAFIEMFDLGRYYSTSPLKLPTLYCETLEEFYGTMLADQPISPERRRALLETIVAQAQSDIEQGSATLGVYLPGQGCFINGWLYGYIHNIPPAKALQSELVRPQILRTAIHEKLGHGFLSAYSALGKVSEKLGRTKLEIANKFGLQPADDPLTQLRAAQAGVLLRNSMLLEEGWSTWIESFLGAHLQADGSPPRYRIEQVLQILKELPEELAQHLAGALVILFGQQDYPPESLLAAVLTLDHLDAPLEAAFAQSLGQPLRYVVGELLVEQARSKQGVNIVPYLVLIAANIHLDPQAISLGDLRELLMSQPRYNPDARLAALSRLRLEQPNSVAELARRAEAELSFAVPPELKRF